MIFTRSQQVAQAAFRQVSARKNQTPPQKKKYLSFARAFPTLIHTCGLAQATAFALAKAGEQQQQVLDDLAAVMQYSGKGDELHAEARGENAITAGRYPILHYLRLTRQALFAATWLKRYAEALLDEDKEQRNSNEPDQSLPGSAEEAEPE
jgi:CRISPR-associated protein Cmr5